MESDRLEQAEDVTSAPDSLPHPVNRETLPPSQFLNRELGILAFNRRVLAQAADESVPLLERLRFLTIVSSNLDELFEIRVAGLKEQIKFGQDGLPPPEAFGAVSREAHALVTEQYRLLNEVVLPALAREGIVFLRREEWTAEQRGWIREYFSNELLPVLTPIGLDPTHPFPRVLNKSLNFVVELEGRDAFGRSSRAAIVQAPRALPRVIRLPRAIGGEGYSFVFLPRFCTRTCRSFSPECRCEAAISSASPATPTSSSTRKRSRTCTRRCRASSCTGISATPCASRWRTAARRRWWTSCCSNSG
jgi:polyphosphate kinase